MLQLTIPEMDFYDEERAEFVKRKREVLQLEHSLVSLAKWEAKWQKPFLGKEEKTTEETMDYIRCMTITQNVSADIYDRLPGDMVRRITEYIHAPMTATTFNDRQNPGNSRNIITAEIIYYSMIVNNIPMECQKWHLNRLITLIRVCNIKNQPPKKIGRKEMASRRRALNAARCSQLNTRG